MKQSNIEKLKTKLGKHNSCIGCKHTTYTDTKFSIICFCNRFNQAVGYFNHDTDMSVVMPKPLKDGCYEEKTKPNSNQGK